MRTKLTILLLINAFVSLAVANEIETHDIPYAKMTSSKGRSEVQINITQDQVAGKTVTTANYDFSRCDTPKNSFFRLDFPTLLVGIPQLFTVEIQNDNPELPLALYITDRNNEVYLARTRVKYQATRSGEVNAKHQSDWSTITIAMPTAPAWSSGDNNRKLDLPVSLAAIMVDMPEKRQGTLRIGKIAVQTDLGAVEFLGYPELADYTSQSGAVQLKLNLTSRDKYPLDNYNYKIEATDLYQHQISYSQEGKFAAELPDNIPIALKNGLHQVKFVLTREQKEVLIFQKNISRLAPIPRSEQPAIIAWDYEYSPLGGVFGNISAQKALDFGANWVRYEHPNWRNNEVSPGVYDFTATLARSKDFISNRIRPIVLQCLYHFPEFTPLSATENFSLGYGSHLQAEAAAFSGITRYFELGNEDNGHTGFIYTEIARHAAAGIRAAQPFAVLANSGTAFIDYNWLQSQNTRKLLEVFDAFCVHPYTNNSTPSQSVSPEKMGTFARLKQLTQLVDQVGGMKQLWSTEYGWPNSNRSASAADTSLDGSGVHRSADTSLDGSGVHRSAGTSLGGEHDRADLYVREMLIGDMAGLEINGLYTWGRDYDIIRHPAGVAIQAFARLRSGHRLAGFYQQGAVYVAVYERAGIGLAAVWQAESGASANPVSGKEVLDIFANKLPRDRDVKVTQSPIYVTEVSPEVLEKARDNSSKNAWEHFSQVNNNTFPGGGDEQQNRQFDFATSSQVTATTDSPALLNILTDWATQDSPVSLATQTAVSRLLDYTLALARQDGQIVATDNRKLRERRKTIMDQIVRINAELEDIPATRYLLDYAAKLEAEAAVNSALTGATASQLYTISHTVYALAERFVRNGQRLQYAVFANLYCQQGQALSEKIAFIPGQRTAVKVRVSSYAKNLVAATVRPQLPAGWRAIPETQQVSVQAGQPVFVDFNFECPQRVENKNVLDIAVEIPGLATRVTSFNNLTIVPAVTVKCEVINGLLPETPIELIVENQADTPVSGQGLVLSPDGNARLAQFTLEETAPFAKTHLTITLDKLTPAVVRDWQVKILFKLVGVSEFSQLIDLDFVYAKRPATAITIDADLADWQTALPLKINQEEYTNGSYGDGWTADNCSAISKLMWDNDFLYFAAAVKDQTFNQQLTGDSTWQQDSVQIIFADPEERKPFEITLALTPAGPQAWGRGKITTAQVAIEYRDNTIYYEAALPWTAFPGALEKMPEKRDFLYGIAINDDDAIVPRRLLERFHGSIVHGKKVDAFAQAKLGWSQNQTADFAARPCVPGESHLNVSAAIDQQEVFFDDFASNTSLEGQVPLDWYYHYNLLPAESITVVTNNVTSLDGSGIHRSADTSLDGSGVHRSAITSLGGNKALLLNNAVGMRPHHFAICIRELQLQPHQHYQLQARVWNAPESKTLIGVCADKWGNVSQKYADIKQSADWQEVYLDFTAPLNGNINIIIKNNSKMQGTMIDYIRVVAKNH